MDQDAGEGEAMAVPFDAYRIRLPDDKDLLMAYKVHKPAIESLALKSEKGRTVFAEAFIENPRLGTLAELCIRSLAEAYGTIFSPMAARDLKTMRLFYDSIDIESPLERIYRIEDNKFWKRLVLAKTTDHYLQFKDDTFDWKGLGISLKYAELVEECPAEFWPEKRMEALAELVKTHVRELHIKKLRPLQDYMFAKYLLRDSDTDKSDSTDVSSSTEEEAGLIEAIDEEFEGEEEQQADSHAVENVDSESKESEELSEGVTAEYARLQLLQAEWNAFEAKRAEEKQKIMEERKQARRARRQAQEERRERREAKILERRLLEEMEKPKRIVVKNIFDLPIEEPEDDDDKKIDKRNIDKLITQRKLYDYPPQHCHHVDLRFVRLFDNLEEFSIIFHPPKLEEKFHSRYFKFSYDDIQRLASGIRELESLRIFRLRKSRMDERKLRMLTSVLKYMNVEVIDFGYNYLEDDCDDAIGELLQNTTTTIKSLELEGNYFNINVMRCLAFALRRYGGHLEYLGLARNPLNDEALHTLCKLLPYMEQIDHLNLTGIKISPAALRCCIADELLRGHKTLLHLDLIAVPIDKKSAEDIIKALENNLTILYLDCRGCNLPFEIECEIEISLRRNRYIVENPYIGDNARTEQEIKEFCERQKNLIVSEVLEAVEVKKACLENRPDIAQRFSEPTVIFDTVEQSDVEESVESEEIIEQEPFVYNANEFNLEQIRAQVLVPGPGQRFYYFRGRNT